MNVILTYFATATATVTATDTERWKLGTTDSSVKKSPNRRHVAQSRNGGRLLRRSRFPSEQSHPLAVKRDLTAVRRERLPA